MSVFLSLRSSVSSVFLPGFEVCLGTEAEQYLLLRFMQHTYTELHPGHNYQHLQGLIDHYWSPSTPFWLVFPHTDSRAGVHQCAGCLWLGTAIDQITGQAYTHLFILYVHPDYRRQGLGTALLQLAEQWAAQKGDQQIGLQVYTNAPAALALYQKRGYETTALSLTKTIGVRS